MAQRQPHLKLNIFNHTHNYIDIIFVGLVLSSFATLFMILA